MENKQKRHDPTHAERSRRYRQKKAQARELEREQLARFLAMSPAQVNAIMGYKAINMAVFCAMAQAQCTKEEIAGALDMSVETFDTRLKENPILVEVLAKCRLYGKSSLRRKQFDVAMAGHPKMLEWLGKQYLGQVDKVEQTNPNLHEAFILGIKGAMPGAFANPDDPQAAAGALDQATNPNLE